MARGECAPAGWRAATLPGGAATERLRLADIGAVNRILDLSPGGRTLSKAGSLEVGMMVLHAATCTGSGPGYLPDYSVEPGQGCSRGAYRNNFV